MPERSSNSVRVIYPEFNRDQVIARLEESAQSAAKQIGLELLILFGSFAKGRYTAASDIDVLAVCDDDAVAKAYEVLLNTAKITNLELHVYGKSAYKRLKASGSSFPHTVESRGIMIFPKQWQRKL